MWFNKRNKGQLRWLVECGVTQLQLLLLLKDKIETMATRAELDAALQQNKDDVEQAITRWQDQLKKAMDDNAKALSDLQQKHDAEEDFSAELGALAETHARIQSLASMPVGAIVNSAGASAASATTGAATATVGGPQAQAAAEAAGGQPIEGQGDHPGNTPTPHDPDPKPEPEPEPASVDQQPSQ